MVFEFLSTLSLRRATLQNFAGHAARQDFYPRSPCGERHISAESAAASVDISIHALLAESDRMCRTADRVRAYISIHALLAESDFLILFPARAPCISIHALLAESDPPSPPKARVLKNFYPRSPCGERLWPGRLARPFFLISIHALLAESDAGEKQRT